MAWGIVRWQPPSKYISWQVLNEGGAGGGLCAVPATILLAILSLPSRVMCLSLEVRRTLCGILIFYGVIFAIMWKAGLIQPVLNQIASYVYILAFAGSLVVVVLVELAEHVRYHLSGPFMALQRMQQQFTRLETKLGLIPAPTEDDTAATATDTQRD